MKFIAEVNVMPLKALLDPQGKAVGKTLVKSGFNEFSNIRIGKHITLEVEEENEDLATQKVIDICKKVLVNPVMEGFEYTLSEL